VIDPTPLVVVHWTDTTNIAEWCTVEEVERFVAGDPSLVSMSFRCRNVGWLLHEDDDCVVVAGRRTDDGRAWGLLERIPRVVVARIERVGQGE
jgi:hypothetical protein